VENLREHVRIRAGRHTLEEAAALEGAPAPDAGRVDRRLRLVPQVREVEDHAAQMRLLREQGGEHRAGPSSDVDDRLDVGPIAREKGGLSCPRARRHRAVEQLRALGVLGEPVEELQPEDVLEGRLVDKDGPAEGIEAKTGEFIWREPGSRHSAWCPEGGLMLAIFQVPNKFYEKDGRVTDPTGKIWDEVWGHTGKG